MRPITHIGATGSTPAPEPQLKPAEDAGTVAGRIPDEVLAGINKAAQQQDQLDPQVASLNSVAVPWLNQRRMEGVVVTTIKAAEQSEVAQLDKAEALAQDAFQRATNPNANFVDRLQALDELKQAAQIRDQVKPGLDPLQQEALDHINQEEQNALEMATVPNVSSQQIDAAKAKMSTAAEESKSLDSWILSQ